MMIVVSNCNAIFNYNPFMLILVITELLVFIQSTLKRNVENISEVSVECRFFVCRPTL